MAAFKDMKTPKEIKEYLLEVLSRMQKNGEEYLYHYTDLESIENIISSGYIWLGSSQQMNDYIEGEFIGSVDEYNRVFFSSFSRVEENLAMYKMYSAKPDGAMMVLPVSIAKELIDNLPDSKEMNKLGKIVRNRKLTDEDVSVHVYWAAVAYKDLHSNILRTGSATNTLISNPLKERDLAGFIKLYGWEYEKEVRLAAMAINPLAENERVALKLPDGFEKTIKIITIPGFDKINHRTIVSKLKRYNVSIHNSEYDGLVDLRVDNLDSADDTIRKLRNENEALNAKIKDLEYRLSTIRKPQLTFSVKNYGTCLKPIKDSEELDGSTIRIEEIQQTEFISRPKELQMGLIHEIPGLTSYDITEYNKQLPTKEEIDAYNRNVHEYHNMKHNGIHIHCELGNNGTAKADNVIVNIEFPDELRLFEWYQIWNLDPPPKPSLPLNPAIEKGAKSKHNQMRQLPRRPLNMEDSELEHEKQLKTINKISILNRHPTWQESAENQTACIQSDSLLHKSQKIYGDFCFIPQEKGTFKIKARLMCEEYIDPEIKEITVHVE